MTNARSNFLKRQEKDKKREYNSRVMNVEQGTFTPLVYSIQGGSAQECSTFHKHVTEMISQKTGEQNSKDLVHSMQIIISNPTISNYMPQRKSSYSKQESRQN